MATPKKPPPQIRLFDEPGPIARKYADRVTIDKAKCRQVLEAILKAYLGKTGRFAQIHHTTHGPQHVHIPGPSKKNPQGTLLEETHVKKPPPQVVVGSREHLQYLCLVTPTDHMQDSDDLYAAHCRLYVDKPWVYTKRVLRLKEHQLAAIFGKYKIGLRNENARYWLGVARTLFIDFGGDPVALFTAAGSTVDNVQRWAKGYAKRHGRDPLLGYAEKITSLYLLYLAELGALPFPKDAFAVDVHVIFQMYQTGAITIHRTTTNTIVAEVLREMICELSVEEGYDKINLSNALWLNGSLGCKECPKDNAAPKLCPLWTLCKGRYATDSYHHNGEINPKDPLYPKGGSAQKFGIKTFERKRPEKKGRGQIVTIKIKTLFDERR